MLARPVREWWKRGRPVVCLMDFVVTKIGEGGGMVLSKKDGAFYYGAGLPKEARV